MSVSEVTWHETINVLPCLYVQCTCTFGTSTEKTTAVPEKPLVCQTQDISAAACFVKTSQSTPENIFAGEKSWQLEPDRVKTRTHVESKGLLQLKVISNQFFLFVNSFGCSARTKSKY